MNDYNIDCRAVDGLLSKYKTRLRDLEHEYSSVNVNSSHANIYVNEIYLLKSIVRDLESLY